MARVTPETVDHVARLARLSLDEGERSTFAAQLEEILGYAESIQRLDTRGVLPMSHAGEPGPLREGPAAPGLARDQALGQGPDVADGLFRVPRVIGG